MRQLIRRDVLARADARVSILLGLAIAICAGSMFWAPARQLAEPRASILLPPLVGGLIFVAMMAMFANAERHGLVRALCAGGAAVLAIGALILTGEASAGRLVAFFWLPAILSIVGALMLTRAKRVSRTRPSR